MRRIVAIEVQSGQAHCARCGGPILPGERWALDHDDNDPSRYLGPSHFGCNSGAANRRSDPETEEERTVRLFYGGRRPTVPVLADPDPENTCIGWSRHWFGPADPRCPNCRAAGRACEDAAALT